MEKDNIDASLGLAFSLVLFERYRKNGILQAELHHVPGIRGRCKGYLHLVEGKVVSCSVEDKQGKRFPISREILMHLDSERGPFEWELVTLPAPSSSVIQTAFPPRLVPNSPIPKSIGRLELEKLDGWTYRQKMMLSMVFEVIDGKRTIEDIKINTPLPDDVVEEALRVLVAMKVIVLT